MVRAIERLIQLDEQETARQRERVASLALAAAVIEALPDALIVIDVSGAIVMINERTELLFGYHRSELIRSQVEILLPAELRDLHAKKRAEYNQFTLSAHARTMGQGLQLVIAHPTPAIGSAGSLTASTKRMVSNTEARLAFAVLTTERKAA